MSSRAENGPNSLPTAISSEQRRHVRFPLTTFVEVLDTNPNTQISGRSSDVSLGGCYVDTLNPFPEGTVIRIRLSKQNVSFEANAKVIFSQIGMGMGVAFTSAEKDQFRIFQQWINQLSGNLPHAPNVLDGERQGGRSIDLHEEQDSVLSELVIALMRKGVLTELEGERMLKRLHR